MSFRVTDECINCGMCEADCPVEAITSDGGKCSIDPTKCVECKYFYEEPQCVSNCPVGAHEKV